MSAAPRKSPLLIYASAGGIAFIIALIMYFSFVVTMQHRADAARSVAERLEKLSERADAYVNTDAHKGIDAYKKTIEDMTSRTQSAIARGPIDVDIGGYLELRATEFGIDDIKWSIAGGIKPPAQGKDDSLRLMGDPNFLKASTIDIQFTARYRDVLSFIKALSPEEGAAKWPFEILKMNMKRAASGAGKNYKVAVEMTVRHLYQ